MRRILMSVSTILLFSMAISCMNGEINTKEVHAIIDEDTAMQTAANWMKIQYPQREIFEIENVDLDMKDNVPINYRIEFKDGGFVIVSANSNRKPIVAYSNSNALTGDNLQANEFVSDLASNMSRIETKPEEVERNKLLWADINNLSDISIYSTTANQVVEPFIETMWSQSGGYHPNFTYNKYTPYVNDNQTAKAPVGCTAVAFAQVLKYYNYPKKGLSYNRYCSSGKSISNCFDGEILEVYFNINYDWNNMPPSLNSYNPEEQIDAVSILLFHVGASINVRYTKHGSSAQIENPSVFSGFRKHFRMTEINLVHREDYSNQEWIELITNEIRNLRPVVLSGYDERIDAGHAYIIDGIDNNGFFHVNWGWGGSANGYFDLNTLIINHPSAGNLSFTEDLIAFVNFTPNVVEEGKKCNGPEGSRCKDGFVCAISNDITNIVDEFSSNEYGTCMDENSDVPEEPEEFEPVTEKFEDQVTKGTWIHYGPFYSMQDINVSMSGTNDADLYVKKGSQPTSSDYDCRPYKSGSAESCSLQGFGNFYVSVNGWAASSDFNLTIAYKK